MYTNIVHGCIWSRPAIVDTAVALQQPETNLLGRPRGPDQIQLGPTLVLGNHRIARLNIVTEREDHGRPRVQTVGLLVRVRGDVGSRVVNERPVA